MEKCDKVGMCGIAIVALSPFIGVGYWKAMLCFGVHYRLAVAVGFAVCIWAIFAGIDMMGKALDMDINGGNRK